MHLHVFFPFLRGTASRAEFDGVFDGPFEYRYVDQVAVAKLVQSRHPSATDGLHVRGFDPTPYVLTGLRSPSRFMMETPLRNDYLRNYAPDWVREHERALFGSTAPRFFVTSVGATGDLAHLEATGMQPLGSRGRFVVFERGLAQRRIESEELTDVLGNGTFEGVVAGFASASARFSDGGDYDLRVGDRAFHGTFRVGERGSVCLTSQADGMETCATIYLRGGVYFAFAPDGRELGNFSAVL